ncbi:MAG: lipoprotein signal peptidase [Chitinophagaceae bacterium]|nr:lipoprotein signal peptidase [Chitinophagaceae bacterium]
MKTLKARHIVLLITLIILLDQALKFWVKLNYPPNQDTGITGLSWFKIYFIENPGMAWGWKFGNETGKMILTLFRLAAVIFGTWYIHHILQKKYHRGFIICVGLIYAGALGNLIDSMFYGVIFDKGLTFDPVTRDYMSYSGVARLSTDGYSSFLHGSVVDMLYFPIFKVHLPSWLPLVGGDSFEFFSPIFNIADASISTGVIALLLFQKRFFRKNEKQPVSGSGETSAKVSDNVQIL